MWGVLPIALYFVVPTLGATTTTFYRLAIAAILITPYLLLTHKLTNGHRLKSAKLSMQILLAGLLLACNYGFYILGLEKTSAEAVQVMIQLAPVLLLLAGIWVFKERFTRVQWFGFACFVIGLLMFFKQQLSQMLVSINDYGYGLIITVIAAVFWTGYAIVQKLLLKNFNSEETMLFFYWIGALVFLPLSDFSTTMQLTATEWALLIFCGLNTLIAYGCFAEALVHMEASRVSATIAIAPLITIAIVQLAPIDNILVEPLTWVSLIGAILVVFGSILAATGKRA